MQTIEDYRRATPGGHIWRNDRYDLSKGNDMARYVARKRYAWPGGYELFAITDDGGILCCDCCKSEYYQIRTSYPGDGWSVVSIDSTANCDESLTCDHCSREIEV